jgi:hypothetical protein
VRDTIEERGTRVDELLAQIEKPWEQEAASTTTTEPPLPISTTTGEDSTRKISDKEERERRKALMNDSFIASRSSFENKMLSQVVELIDSKRRFAITSHARPDGDSLGSSLGLYWLLRALDKDATVIMRDAVPPAYRKLPGAKDILVTDIVDKVYDAVFVIECSGVERPGITDLDKEFVVNIDHHSTTALFGDIN